MTAAALAPLAIYNGNGVTVAFAAPFRFLASSLAVDLISAAGVVTRLIEGVDYTVAGGTSDAGGTVTLTVAPALGFRLRIQRETARSQGTDYETTDTFPAETHEQALDRAMLIAQEQDVAHADLEARSLRVADGGTGLELPVATTGTMLIGYDDAGALGVLDGEAFRGATGATGASVVDAALPLSNFYLPEHGADLRTAWQDAIAAATNGSNPPKVVNDYGAAAMQVWEPVQTQSKATIDASWANFYLKRTLRIPACDLLEIDFRGAQIALKGPGGVARAGQAVVGGTWFGGFLTVTGNVGELRLRNVDVEGGFTGDTVGQTNLNLYDKGFVAQDLTVGKILMERVVLHGFAGEIMYDNSSALHESRDCHFYNSGHSCWNPSGRGRVAAYNLQAGIARQPAEVLGGAGHDYFGGRFYKGGNDCAFLGTGPSAVATRPYTWSARATDGSAPPFINFHGTRFEQCGTLLVGSYTRGRIVTVDTPVYASLSTPAVQDIDLDIEAWADRANNFLGFALGGPANLTTQVDGAPAGTYYEKTRNVRVQIDCRRTLLAAGAGYKVSPAVNVLAGLLDKDTCQCSVRGEAGTAWEVTGAPPVGFAVPLIVTEREFRQLAYGAIGLDFNSANKAYDILTASMSLNPTVDGTANITINTTYGYANGQRFRFFMDAVAGAQSGARIQAFAKNGAGLRLNADRTVRRFGEFLELQYDANSGKWCEAAFLDQGP